MDYKAVMIDILRQHRLREAALANTKAMILDKEAEIRSIKGANPEREPVRRSGNGQEDKLLNLIVERDTLRGVYKINKAYVDQVQRGLNALDDEERRIISAFFIDRKAGVSTDICEMLNCEKSEAYRRRDAALRKITIACYGVLEL